MRPSADHPVLAQILRKPPFSDRPPSLSFQDPGRVSTAVVPSAENSFSDIIAEAVFRLGPGDVVLRMAGCGTCTARKMDHLRDAMFTGRFDANPLHAK